MMKGRIQQTGTPQMPVLVIKDGPVVNADVPGAAAGLGLAKGQWRPVYYERVGNRVMAVAETEAELRERLMSARFGCSSVLAARLGVAHDSQCEHAEPGVSTNTRRIGAISP